MTPKFIRLTEVPNRHTTVSLIISVDDIKFITPSEKNSGDTHIRMKDDKFYFVKESIDDIWLKLNTDMTMQPVLMTADETLKYYKIRDGI